MVTMTYDLHFLHERKPIYYPELAGYIQRIAGTFWTAESISGLILGVYPRYPDAVTRIRQFSASGYAEFPSNTKACLDCETEFTPFNESGICTTCERWLSYIMKADNPASIRFGGHLFWKGAEIIKLPLPGWEDDIITWKWFRGFEGMEFTLYNSDPEVPSQTSTNLYYHGRIPKLYQGELLNNVCRITHECDLR